MHATMTLRRRRETRHLRLRYLGHDSLLFVLDRTGSRSRALRFSQPGLASSLRFSMIHEHASTVHGMRMLQDNGINNIYEKAERERAEARWRGGRRRKEVYTEANRASSSVADPIRQSHVRSSHHLHYPTLCRTTVTNQSSSSPKLPYSPSPTLDRLVATSPQSPLIGSRSGSVSNRIGTS